MKKVMIVGGQVSFIQGSLSRHLREHDVEIGWHASSKDGGKPYSGLPQGCEGVIVITNVANHSIHDKAVVDSKARSLPLARVCSRWAKALPILRMTGILGPATNGEDEGFPIEEDLVTAALQYVIQARRDKRIPKKAETRGAIQRAFGKRARLTKMALDRVYNEAAAQAPILPQIDANELSREVRVWTTALLEEDPRLVLNPNEITQWITDNTQFSDHPTAIANAVLAKIGEIRKRWVGQKHRDRSFIRKFRNKWIKDWFQRALQGEDAWPSFNLIKARCIQIFGHRLNWGTVRSIRAEVLGNWALDLELWTKVQQKADKKYDTKHDLLDLLETGKIKGVKIPGGNREIWMTSLTALDDYVGDGVSLVKRSRQQPTTTKFTSAPLKDSVQVSADALASLEERLLSGVAKLIEPIRKKVETLKEDVRHWTDITFNTMDEVESLKALIGVPEDTRPAYKTLCDLISGELEVGADRMRHLLEPIQQEVQLNGCKLQKVWEMSSQLDGIRDQVGDLESTFKKAVAQINPLAQIPGALEMSKVSVQMELSRPTTPERDV
jgi:hypothetical protein